MLNGNKHTPKIFKPIKLVLNSFSYNVEITMSNLTSKVKLILNNLQKNLRQWYHKPTTIYLIIFPPNAYI